MSAGECPFPPSAKALYPESFNEAPACLPGNGVEGERHVPARGAASMRPRHVCRGMVSPSPARYRHRSASMRPRHVCRGMPPSPQLARAVAGFNEAPACLPGNVGGSAEYDPRAAQASMRPRHVCRGMPEGAPGGRGRWPGGFNEAPACLPGNDADAATFTPNVLTPLQ